MRLGPLPAGEPPYSSLAKTVRNGVTLYAVVLHGHIAGTAYLVPSLGVEVMATGPEAGKVLTRIGESVRDQVLAAITRNPTTIKAPHSWHTADFAGLRFAVPPGWAMTRTQDAHQCGLRDDLAAWQLRLVSSGTVILDTDTKGSYFPCPTEFLPRAAVNGLDVDEGSKRVPNSVPAGALPLTINGMHAYVDMSNLLSVLVVLIEVPGRAIPVEVSIGLADATTATRLLGSCARA